MATTTQQENPMNQELAETTPRALAMPTASAMAEVLAEQNKIRQVLKAYIEENMISGIDYGIIPGIEKPTLLQPGAEKMAEIFRCTPDYMVTRREEDWDKPFFFYEFRCQLINRDTGAVIAEGMGSCNSHEAKYRWRNAGRKCPKCGKEQIIKGKAEFGGGWLCWKKNGGCGEKFSDGDKAIEGQEVGKILNENVADQVNTILKIAKKRALVDASIVPCRRYGFQFNQDLEDMADGSYEAPKPAPKETEAPAPSKGGISKETADKIYVHLEMRKLKMADPIVFNHVNKCIKRTMGRDFRVEDLSEAEGRMVLNDVFPAIDKLGNPITDAAKESVGKLLKSINKSWDMDNAKFRGWLETVLKHPIGQGMFISDLKEWEGLAIVAELEALIRNMNGGKRDGDRNQ
jgi:hypothetical protein